jgi:hypothetical protein
MKESVRLAQEALKKSADRQQAEDQVLLTKPVEQLTNYDVDRMTGDIYKQRINTDPKFVELINGKTK